MLETKIQSLGHTTFLIETMGTRFIIDPNFANCLGLLKRRNPAVFDPATLHTVDAVLISNSRMNRLHLPSLKYFKQRRAKILARPDILPIISRFYGFDTQALTPERETPLSDGVTVTLFPAAHGCWRRFQWHATAAHFLIKTPDKTMFYASDTRLDPALFKRIGHSRPVDTALFPVDKICHDMLAAGRFLDLDKTLDAAADLGAKTIIPYGYGTFSWPGKDAGAPLKQFLERAATAGIADKIKILKPGEGI